MRDEPKQRDWTLRGRLMRRRAIKSMEIDGSEGTPRQDKELCCNKIEAEASRNQ